MEKLPPKPDKNKHNKEKLLKLDNKDLIDKFIQLKAHNELLKKMSTILSCDQIEVEENQRAFDSTNWYFRRVLLRFLYLGWDYQGLTVQDDTNQTIEYHLFQALTKSSLIEKRETSQYHRCGRTDKGVSAFGQVISLNLRSLHPPEKQHLPESLASELKYCKMLNQLLPKEIRAVAWMPVPDDKADYSARFDCIQRQYKYFFPLSNFDVSAMKAACARLVGTHDFRHLCKMDVANGVIEFRREIFNADILPVEEEGEDPTTMYYLMIEGSAFLWHQIRCIMGVLILIGQGKEKPEVITELLDVEKYPRKPQYNLAVEVPLNLFNCSYELEEDQPWIYDEHEHNLVIEHLQKEWTAENTKSSMIKEAIRSLEMEYASITDCIEDRVVAYGDSLLQGVTPKKHVALLKRETCSSLEEKIEVYRKKRNFEDKNEDK